MEYARTRLSNDVKQNKVTNRQFNGILSVIGHALKTEGVQGVVENL